MALRLSGRPGVRSLELRLRKPWPPLEARPAAAASRGSGAAAAPPHPPWRVVNDRPTRHRRDLGLQASKKRKTARRSKGGNLRAASNARNRFPTGWAVGRGAFLSPGSGPRRKLANGSTPGVFYRKTLGISIRVTAKPLVNLSLLLERRVKRPKPRGFVFFFFFFFFFLCFFFVFVLENRAPGWKRRASRR